MALRTADGGAIVTKDDWLTFFVHEMKFSQKSSATYAKLLSEDAVTGQLLEQNIDVPNMKNCIGMEFEEFLKLKRYIHSKLSSKLPRPSIKMNCTQEEYDKFVLDWQKYKDDRQLCETSTLYLNLFNSCSVELRQHIQSVTATKRVEKELLELIQGIAVSNKELHIHIKEFMKMSQNEGENCHQYLRRVQTKATHCGFTQIGIESCVKDRFVRGLRSIAVRNKLLKFETPKMCITELFSEALKQERALQLCRDYADRQEKQQKSNT